jgi:hypothetical protein
MLCVCLGLYSVQQACKRHAILRSCAYLFLCAMHWEVGEGGGLNAKNHVVVRLLVCEVGVIAADNMITITLLLQL